MKILFIIPYFGSTPRWIRYFLLSCKFNPDVNWLIYGDLNLEGIRVPDNVKIMKASLRDFDQLIKENTGITMQTLSAYKVCDYRPAFADIFCKQIEDFEYWGYCDLDLIFGNLSKALNRLNYSTSDVITSGDKYLSGHFTLYRNAAYLNKAYKKIWKFKQRMADNSGHYCLDERCNYIGDPEMLSGNKPSGKLLHKIIRSFRYRLYNRLPWPQDISKIIFQMHDKNEISMLKMSDYGADEKYLARKEKKWEICWEDGRLFDEKAKQEIYYFHFIKSKIYSDFKVSDQSISSSFIITEKGIRPY